MPTKPTDHIDWTDGSALKVTEPTSGKKLLGWTKSERPPFQFMNWLFYQLDQWDQYLEAITDLHTTQIATALTYGTAAGISASNVGHVKLTGITVQAQLDQTDSALKDIYDAITAGLGIDLVGYVPTVPSDWSPAPSNAGAGLDQLAARVKVVENLVAGTDFLDKSFCDYAIPADAPNGGGNTGLTDTTLTNPRGIKLAEIQTLYGEDRVYCSEIQRTGNFDANGRPEFEITSPKPDMRIRLYGDWIMNDGNPLGSFGSPFSCIFPGDYILITGVFDALAIMAVFGGTNNSDQIEIWIDGVNTGQFLNTRGNTEANQQFYDNANNIVSHSVLGGLSSDLHTVKLVNGSSGGGQELYFTGVSMINTIATDMPGKAWVNKVLQTYVKAAISAPSVTRKGGKIVRYIDRADNLRKDTVQNVLVLETSSLSIGSGASSLSVTSSTGFQANDIIYITDGPSNSELLKVSSTSLGTIATTTPTVNSYTNATVGLYGKTLTATDHSNEKVLYRNNYRAYGMVGQSMLPSARTPNGTPYTANATVEYTAPDGASRLYLSAANANNINSQDAMFFTNAQDLVFEFVGTGLDIMMDSGGAGTFNVTIDGVAMGSYTVTTGHYLKGVKICSDLPYGHHIIKIHHVEVDNNGAIVDFVVYGPKDNATMLSLSKGDIISERTKLANYLFMPNFSSGANNGGVYASMGTVYQAVNRHCYFVDGTGGTVNWEPESITDADGIVGEIFRTDRTNAYVERWFFGTGFDVAFEVNNAFGIVQMTVDGNTLTSANFPSATFHNTQFATFNSSTGKLDTYFGTGGKPVDRFGAQGLSAAPSWHVLRMTVTGTKNPSSSGYFLWLNGFFIHDMPWSGESFQPGYLGNANQYFGGVWDKRKRDAIGSRPLACFTNQMSVFNQSHPVASLEPFSGMTVMVDLEEAATVHVSAWATIGTQNNGYNLYPILTVNGSSDYGSGAGQTAYGPTTDGASLYKNIVITKEVYLGAGRHFLWVYFTNTAGGGNINTNSGGCGMSVHEIAKRVG